MDIIQSDFENLVNNEWKNNHLGM